MRSASGRGCTLRATCVQKTTCSDLSQIKYVRWSSALYGRWAFIGSARCLSTDGRWKPAWATPCFMDITQASPYEMTWLTSADAFQMGLMCKLYALQERNDEDDRRRYPANRCRLGGK